MELSNTRPCTLAVVAFLSVSASMSSLAQQAGKPAPVDQSASVAGDQLVGPGYRRVFVAQRQPIGAEELGARGAAGKPTRLDAATGEQVLDTFVDHLPAGWMLERPAGLEGKAVDSLGNPIVNETPGLPGWAQRDVDGLRASVAQWRDQLLQDRAAGREARETEGILGNFIGQAISRAIGIDDLVNIDDASLMSPGLAGSVLGYLHYYENIRWANGELFGYAYAPTVYPARIAGFAARHGQSLADIQRVEAGGYGARGGNCYARSTFARGMTNLSGQTDIWVATGQDDVSADIPTGFPIFWFYPCQTGTNNDQVRVSSNGFITFFQHGGGTLNGTNFVNTVIPSATDPDGFAAPWWDDLLIQTNQGNTDRVSYKTEGAVDQRVFTVEWFSMSRRLGDTDDYHFFQVKLYETTGVIEFHYGLDAAGWQTDVLDNSTTGIEDYTGAEGLCGVNCNNDNNPPPTSDFRYTLFRPSNDLCADATELVSGARLNQVDLRSATGTSDSTCGDSSNNRDVWYRYTATCTGTLRVTTCGTRDDNGDNVGPDTVLTLHTGCPGTLANQVACSDDAGGAGCDVTDSTVTRAMTIGQSILIRVTHFGDLAFRLGDGRFDLAVDFTPTTAALNDDCPDALPLLDGGTGAGNLSCDSNDGQSNCGVSTFNNDAWFKFTAPSFGALTVHACGSRDINGDETGIDAVLSLHSGCPGTVANQLACNDDGNIPGCDSYDSLVVSPGLTPAQVVYIRVSHFGSGPGSFGNGRFVIHTDFTPCGSADFDCDGDTGTDADIESFFRCIAGTCPLPPCASTGDFDGDGDVATDADIEAFFRVLAGGAC